MADGDVAPLARGAARRGLRARGPRLRPAHAADDVPGPFDETEWTSYHPDAHRLFTAHAAGVNAFIEQNRDNLPVESGSPASSPRPWTAETAVLRWAALGVPSVRGHAIHEMQLALNVARYGAEEANRRFAPDPWDDLVVPDGLDVSIITEDILDAMRAGDGDPFTAGRLPALEIVEPWRDSSARGSRGRRGSCPASSPPRAATTGS